MSASERHPALELLRGLRPAVDALLARYEAATRHEQAAGSYGDGEGRRRAAAEREAVGEEYASLSRDLGNVCLTLLRHALDWNPDALRLALVAALEPELRPIADAVARLEDRRCR